MTTFKRNIILSIGVLAFCIALVSLKNEFTRFLPGYNTGLPAIIEESQTKQLDTLFLGSSTFKQGIDITKFHHEDQETAYLLAYNGNQPITMLLEFRYLLEHGVRPKTLLIDFYPYLAAALPKLSDTRLLLETDTKFKWALWHELCAADQCSVETFHELFFTAANAIVVFWPIYQRMTAQQSYRGKSTQRVDGSTTEALRARPPLGERDGLQNTQLDALKTLVLEAKAHQIDVFFVETPKYETLRTQKAYLQYLSAMLNDALGYMPKDRIILSDELDFDTNEAAYFKDLVHLSSEGAAVFSEKLIEKLKTRN